MKPLQPCLSHPPQLLLKAQNIRAAIFDVDGVLTDGRIYLDAQGECMKAFNTLDGHGLKLLMHADIIPIIITGRDAPAVRKRMADLQIIHALFGIHDKLTAAHTVLSQLGIKWAHTAVVGDDWPDLPLLMRAGFAAAPPNAHPEVLALADHITTTPGGQGAAREVCDLLLLASGRYEQLLQTHLMTLDTTSNST
jgi:3-deoxy-D-manno-octulosonate 8-phosphate phosphatase (KDO 8-P phosphatase)